MNTCIIRFNNKSDVLLIKHRDRQWEFPGGKIDNEKDCYKGSGFIDLIKSVSREFKEEVGNGLGCIGCPCEMIFKQDSSTIFFVYKYQPCVFNCFEKYKETLQDKILNSPDSKIECIKEFKINELPLLSFETDRELIKLINK